MEAQLSYYRSGQKYDGQAMLGIPNRTPVYNENQFTHVPPALALVFLDEDPSSINDGLFAIWMTPGRWGDLPAIWHSRGCNFSFADGHVEHWRWMDARTLVLTSGVTTTPNNTDLQRLQDAYPYQ